MLYRNKLFPLQVIFALTDACNSKCKTCNIWKGMNKKHIKGCQVLSVVDFFIDSLAWVVLSGGEPSLYPELEKVIVNLLKRDISSISLVTNGLLPDFWIEMFKKLESEIPHSKVKLNIAVSLDGIDNVHDNIRGIEGAFDKAFNTFNVLCSFSENLSWLNVDINYTVSVYNAGKLENFLDFIENNFNSNMLGKVNLVLEQFSPYYGTEENNVFDFYTKFKSNILRDLENYKERVIPVKFQTKTLITDIIKKSLLFFLNGIGEFMQNNLLLIPFCSAGKNIIYVDSSGKIYPCSQWNKTFARVWEDGVKLNINKYNEILHSIQKGACGGCWAPCEVFCSWMYSKFPYIF